MEPVGTSGLPPLLAAVPVLVHVANLPVTEAEEAVDEGLSNLTELVPVRSKQPTCASDRILAAEEVFVDEQQGHPQLQEEPAEGDAVVDPLLLPLRPDSDEIEDSLALDIKPHPVTGMLQDLNVHHVTAPAATSEMPSNAPSEGASETASETQSETISVPTSITPTFQVPPHLLGRTVENPAADIPPGRRMQKPRLGVRVPYRNLTSQIVTQNEIAQEIFERSAKKHPIIMDSAPEGRIATTDLFTRKLTQRLASSISPQAQKPKASVPETIGPLKALLPNKQAPALVDGLRLSPGFTYSEKDKTLDDAELLSILEGDGDPVWLPDKLLRKVEGTSPPSAPVLSPVVPPQPVSSSPTAPVTPSPPKLDPVLEKQLALKQLSELPIKFPSKKPEKKVDKTEKADKPAPTRRRNPKIKKEVIAEEGLILKMDLDAAPILEPVIPLDPLALPNGGGGTENAPPNVPVKKPHSNRKRKLTPEVEAVLKRPRLTKRTDNVANGKGKGGKATQTPAVPTEVNKKTNKKAKPESPVVIVTNGSVEPATKKKTPVKRVLKSKAESAPKKASPRTTPNKTAKGSSKTASKSQPTPPLPKQQRNALVEKVVEPTKVAAQVAPAALSTDATQTPPAPQPAPVPAQEPLAMTPPQPAIVKKQARINRELEHLLGDEGAVNMLYAVEGQHNKRKVSSKDLALKVRLVKTAVMRLSTSPLGHVPLALRARRSLNTVEPPKLTKMGGKRRQRQLSDESHESTRSPPYLTPVDGAGAHVFAPRQKLTADDSRIIRRHSSSSSFSSPSVSPRRVSVEDGKGEAAGSSAAGSPRKRGIPIYVRDTAKNMTYSGKKKPTVVNPVALNLSHQMKELQAKRPHLLPNPLALKKKELKKMKKINKGLEGATAAVLAAKEAARLRKVQQAAERRASEQLAKAKEAAEQLLEIQLQVQHLANGSQEVAIPPTAIKLEGGRKGAAPHSPDATSYCNLLKTLDQRGRRPQAEERLPQRATLRHCAGTYNYKEITVRRFDNVVQIVLAPASTKMCSALNVQVLRELRDALQQVRKDDSCRVVLLTSSGSIFCQGIDISTLIHSNMEKRKTAAIELSLALKDFLKCVANYPKPLVAGVQGAAVGLGVTMLPLFDMVVASDKATFHTPYAQLGQVPEGAATLTLPYMFGHTTTSELLLNCRKLTANEALQFGLVTRVLWPDRFLEELIPAVKTIAQQSAQSMEATKALLRHGLRTKFDAALESETHLLVTHWTSQECQTSFQRMIDNEEVSLQRQRSVEV